MERGPEVSAQSTRIMTEPRITRLPSQATEGNSYGRKPARRGMLMDRQQREEYAREAYLIDGWQDNRRY